MRVIDSVKFRVSHFYSKTKKSINEWIATVNKTPIFVLGNQKSGTTAIAALLAGRAGLSVTWDFTHRYNSTVVDVNKREKSVNQIISKSKIQFSYDVIKDPNLTFMYRGLRDRFPKGKFVIVLRDPRSNIRSILDRLRIQGDKNRLRCSAYSNISDGWRRIIEGKYGLGIKEGNYIDRLAQRWKEAAYNFLRNKQEMECIKYEDFIKNKIESIDEVVYNLGEERVNDIQDIANRQFQPRGQRRNIDWLSFFGEANLERIESRCSEAMKSLGYNDFRVL